jgi:hypothetical protein
MELSEGDRRFGFAFCGDGTAGDSDLPLPKTLPPPRTRFDMIMFGEYPRVGTDVHVEYRARRGKSTSNVLVIRSLNSSPPGPPTLQGPGANLWTNKCWEVSTEELHFYNIC